MQKCETKGDFEGPLAPRAGIHVWRTPSRDLTFRRSLKVNGVCITYFLAFSSGLVHGRQLVHHQLETRRSLHGSIWVPPSHLECVVFRMCARLPGLLFERLVHELRRPELGHILALLGERKREREKDVPMAAVHLPPRKLRVHGHYSRG